MGELEAKVQLGRERERERERETIPVASLP